MNEEDFRQAINNMLMMQNNNDRNFQILQAQIDRLEKQLSEFLKINVEVVKNIQAIPE